jgi:hypothetical protein
LSYKKRQLQKKLKKYTKEGHRYKMAFIKKKTLAKNQEKRVVYKTEYISKTVNKHWSYITFINKAYIDLTL